MKTSQLIQCTVGGIFLAVGCKADPLPDPSAAVDEVSNTGTTLALSAPGDAGVLAIVANGTGCPPLADGTHDLQFTLSPDAQGGTVTFGHYEASVAPAASRFAAKDCTVSVSVAPRDGYTFSMESFDLTGYAFLDSAGMRATPRAYYYVQGDLERNARVDSPLTGPANQNYALHSQVAAADAAWSPCGTSRGLNLLTGITLRNNDTKTGTGYIQITQLAFRIQWATCP